MDAAVGSCMASSSVYARIAASLATADRKSVVAVPELSASSNGCSASEPWRRPTETENLA